MNAYILCGGQSRRMGKAKALLPFRGMPMAMYIAQKLISSGFSNVYAVVKESLSLDLPQLIESATIHHPLFGVAEALQHSPKPFCLITPCDLPFVSIDTFQTLRKKSCFTTALATSQKQPLLGVFPKRLASDALHYAERSLSVMNFVETSQTFNLSACELININTPQNLKDHR